MIRWEIDRPAPKNRGRQVSLDQASARAGATRFEQEVPFAPGDPLGTWNIRVTAGGEAAIDRPVLIYDAPARKRASREERELLEARKH